MKKHLGSNEDFDFIEKHLRSKIKSDVITGR